ncbi:MAG: alpha/beta hydrolase [Oscillospiraceae bacterium]|nr:alpha/beta hydrolase [Oscillospiraceae bacterium]
MLDSGRESKKEKRFFIIFVIVVIVVGGALFLWGQHNAALSVFDAGFLRYDIEKIRDDDPDWQLTEAEAARRAALLEEAAAWKASAGGERRTFEAVTASTAVEGAPRLEIGYDVYDRGSDTTVVILHGYDESAEESEIFAPYWWEKGFNVIVPDMRGHRGGDMEATTFGVWESLDLYDLIKAEGLDAEDKTLVVCGRSIGGDAALLLAENRELVSGIDALVVETVYSNLKTYELHCLRHEFSLGNLFVGEMLDTLVRRAFAIVPQNVDLRSGAPLTKIPAVFIAADEKVVGGAMTKEVYDLWAGEKRLVWLPDGRYPGVYADALDSGEYDAAVSAILNIIQ